METITAWLREAFREKLPAGMPGFTARPAQDRLAWAIARAFFGDPGASPVLGEAGTGTGKSFAYLIPAVAKARDAGAPVVISTAAIQLQEQLLRKDIPMLRRILGDFRAAVAKGRGNYLCRIRLDDLAVLTGATDDPEMAALLAWADQTPTGDREELTFDPGAAWAKVAGGDDCPGRRCPYAQRGECGYYVAKDAAREADVVVTNHHLLALAAAIPDGDLLPPRSALVLDEAHRFEEAAMRAFGMEFSPNGARRFVAGAEREGIIPRDGELAHAARRELDTWDALVKDVRGTAMSELPAAIGILERVAEALTAIVCAMPLPPLGGIILTPDDCRLTALRKRGENTLATAIRILAAVERPELGVAHIPGDHNKAVLTPASVAERLRGAGLWTDAPAALVSATLASGAGGEAFGHLRRRLGLPPGGRELVLPSPFRWREQAALYAPDGLPDPKDQEAFRAAVIPHIGRLLLLSHGRALVLFSSRAGMDAAVQALRPRLPFRLLAQGEGGASELARAFREDESSCLFGLATFREGLDVPGGALSMLIMDRLPFGVPTDPVARARSDLVAASGGSPFADLAVPEAVIRLKQGVGRLIRTERDRGVVAILDRRLHDTQWGLQMRAALPPMRVVRSMEGLLPFLAPAPERGAAGCG